MRLSFGEIIILVILSFNFLHAQIDSTITTSDIINNIIEESSEDNESESDLYYEDFESLRNNPININTADIFELQQVPLINMAKAREIITYMKKFGRIFSINELLNISGFNKNIVNSISQFISLSDDHRINSKSKDNIMRLFNGVFKLKLRNRFIQNLQKKEGFKNGKFLGTSLRNYNRLQFSLDKRIGINFLTDKDEGEKKYDDFYSYSFWIKDFSILKYFTAGDFLVEAGQGLLLWSPFVYSKGSDVISPLIRRSSKIRTYTSSGEAGFMRGVAALFNISNFNITLYYSNNYFDATIDSVNNIITSFKIDGYHRTETELSKFHNSRRISYGSVLEYTVPNKLKTGFILTNTIFDKAVKINDFENKNVFKNYSFYYDIFLNKVEFSGETADDGKRIATINSLQYLVSDKLKSIISFRYYEPSFKSIYGNGFGESSNTSNEMGFYTGLALKTTIGKFKFYFDSYKSPQKTYNDIFPSNGWDMNLVFLSKTYSHLNFIFRYSYSNDEEMVDFKNFKLHTPQIKNRIKFEFKKRYKFITLKSRFDFVNTSVDLTNQEENGFMFYQDIKYTPTFNLKFYGRVIFFRTDSYNSAIYEFENDLEGVFRSYALFGQGLRWYLISKYNVLSTLSLSIKYSETYKPDDKSLGSGYALIEGNLDNQISLQLDFRK